MVCDEALRGILVMRCCERGLGSEVNASCELHMQDWSLTVQEIFSEIERDQGVGGVK